MKPVWRRSERHPHSETRKTVAEVSGEIALLSGLLRDLAATVSGHDRDVATLAEEIVHLRERAGSAGSRDTAAADAGFPGRSRPPRIPVIPPGRGQLEDLPAPQSAPTMGQVEEGSTPCRRDAVLAAGQ